MSRQLAYRIRVKMEESAPSATRRGVAMSVPVREATLESPATKTGTSAQKVYIDILKIGRCYDTIIIATQILALLVRV